jgi:hypothetical protein
MAPPRQLSAAAARSGSLAHLVVEEPLLVQRIEVPSALSAAMAGIDRRDEVGALGEDEAEILGAQRAADQLQPPFEAST